MKSFARSKRLWHVVLVLIVVTLLSACGGEATPTEEPTEAAEEPTEEPTEVPTEEPTEAAEEEPTAEPTEAAVTNSVTVEDQALGEDNSVNVPAATSDTPGWMVIHADQDGGPGPVIGHAPVTAGENEDVGVEIDAEAATETLYAMLHVDAGTEGEYEFPGDDVPARDAEGNVVVRPFQVTMMGDGESEGEGEVMTTTVAIVDSAFEPVELTVAAGTTVVWNQEGSAPHTVTADDGAFDSGTLNTGDTFEFTFEEPGEYPYYCTFHGAAGGEGMAGTVVVTEGDS